jgi:hypothetical protein
MNFFSTHIFHQSSPVAESIQGMNGRQLQVAKELSEESGPGKLPSIGGGIPWELLVFCDPIATVDKNSGV